MVEEYKYLSVHLDEMLNNSIPDSRSSLQASHIHTVTMMSYATLHVLNFSVIGSRLSYLAYVYVCHYGSCSDVVKSDPLCLGLNQVLLFAESSQSLWSRNTDEPKTHQTSFTCIAALLEITHRCKDCASVHTWHRILQHKSNVLIYARINILLENCHKTIWFIVISTGTVLLSSQISYLARFEYISECQADGSGLQCKALWVNTN